LKLSAYLAPGKRDPAFVTNLRKDLFIIAGFLCGCLLGGFAGKHLGLAAILIPGSLLLFVRKVY
jgi:hypothetical protein